MRAKVPFRNRNHTGWWIASFIERFEYDDENRSDLNRRCLAWENTILVRARDREAAYRKALLHGRRSHGHKGWNEKSGRKGSWRFEGLTQLLPVYEPIQDGAEVLWTALDGVSVRKVKSRIRRKRHLSVFDDRDP
jgi:hypothetical protein